jgi:hypothetical protein
VFDQRGVLIATSDGKTDADAWNRIGVEIERQGYEVE